MTNFIRMSFAVDRMASLRMTTFVCMSFVVDRMASLMTRFVRVSLAILGNSHGAASLS
jgi:hypothetical protein